VRKRAYFLLAKFACETVFDSAHHCTPLALPPHTTCNVSLQAQKFAREQVVYDATARAHVYTHGGALSSELCATGVKRTAF
jgi:hypothetical protein